MKTATLFLISSIGMLTDILFLSGVCLGLVAFLFYRWNIRNDKRVERSKESFQKVMNKECECEKSCNEYCANSKRYNL